MATIQYRPELNPLTTPVSYKLRFVPQNTGGYDEVARLQRFSRQQPKRQGRKPRLIGCAAQERLSR